MTKYKYITKDSSIVKVTETNINTHSSKGD